MAALQNQHEPAGTGVRLVHQVAESPLGGLWLALDQRRGPPGEYLLLRYVSLAGGATSDALERVAAAARAALSLRHDLLLPVVEVQQHPLVVAYEYVDAQPLSTLQSRARARELLFPVGVSLRLIIDLLRALQAVHESWLGWPTEVPYGGLSPASVLVSQEGHTRLCDALVASSARLQRGFDLSAAELAYRAPEQLYASIAPEPSTDVFIAGILLWELVTGRPLFSGPKEVIDRQLLEHDLPFASAELRADCPLSRGLIELLDCSLALDPNQRPPTPGGLAKALERCGHVVASHAEVAAFIQELAGLQQEPAQPAEMPAAAAAEWRATSAPSGAAAPGSLATALERALERRRATGEFPAFTRAPGRAVFTRAPGRAVSTRAPGRAGPRPSPLERLATAAPRAPAALLPRAAALAPLPLPTLPPPLPLLQHEGPAAASSEDEEKTTVLRAVRDPGTVRGDTTPSAPVRLAPKRALLAAMASVVLLIQLWVLNLTRSHQERSRSSSPTQSELSLQPAPPER